MKSVRNVALAAVLTVSAFAAATFTSCKKSDDAPARDAFIGTWKGTDICTSGTYNITLSVGTSSDEMKAIVNNPGGFGNAVTITGTVNSTNQLVFTNADVTGGRTLTGTMTFSGTAMQFQYSVSSSSGNDNCAGAYTKQ